jgi:predicted RND superfamily exporter protein
VTVRGRIEGGFAAWARLVIRGRWVAIAVMLALTGSLGSLVPQARVDNSDESFLKPDDPERLRYDWYKERFGREDDINIVLHPPEVFDLGFLAKLRDLHRDIENAVPYVEEVTSLVNARDTRGEADELIVGDLMKSWPESDADLALLRNRVSANPLYTDTLVTATGEYTAMAIRPFTYSTLGSDDDALEGFEDIANAGGGEDSASKPDALTEAEGAELVRKLREVVARYESDDLPIYVMGGPVLEEAFGKIMQRDVAVSLSGALVAIMALLFILFRRLSGVLMPVVVVMTSVASSVGVMVMLDIPFSVTLNILPAFLLVVGICDSVHILVIVYQQLAAGESRDDAIVFALRHSGLAVVMTSVTTAAGLVSFTVADLQAVAQLGVIAPIGVMLAMIYSLALLPALLSLMPLKARSRDLARPGQRALNQLLAKLGDWATQHPGRVLGMTTFLLIAGLGGILQVRFAHDGVRWFPEHDLMRIAAELVDREFKGASSLEAVIDTGRENGLHDPDTMHKIERAMRMSEMLNVGQQPVSKSISIVDILKEIHQALNENDPAYYSVPDERQLIAQELLLFENSGSDDLEDFTDSQFQLARISIRTPWVDAMLYPVFVEEVRQTFRKIFGDEFKIDLTGGAVIFTRLFRSVILTMARSYVLALLVITPMLILLVGNLKRGLLAMIPNLIPIYLALSLMGWLGIPLDASTLLVGGILLGVAVDDTIHFMHKFNRYYDDCGDPAQAVHETLATTGSALLFTSLILTFGFATFMMAYMINLNWFGMVIAFATVVAFLADVLVAPALMVLVTRRRATGLRDLPANDLQPR